MIKNKIKTILGRFRGPVEENNKLLKEIEWANVYHDSIRDNEDLQKLSLKIGRWAGNYSFFFLVHRILKDFQPKKIVEFGLGESSKFISTYNSSNANLCEHVVIEHDIEWVRIFNDSFQNNNIHIQHHDLSKKKINGYEYNGYDNVKDIPADADFYLIDGPFGSPNYSRYDILSVLERIRPEQEFILILDDFNREGEQQTAIQILNMFESKGKQVFSVKYEGVKAQFVLVTEKFRYVLSL